MMPACLICFVREVDVVADGVAAGRRLPGGRAGVQPRDHVAAGEVVELDAGEALRRRRGRGRGRRRRGCRGCGGSGCRGRRRSRGGGGRRGRRGSRGRGGRRRRRCCRGSSRRSRGRSRRRAGTARREERGGSTEEASAEHLAPADGALKELWASRNGRSAWRRRTSWPPPSEPPTARLASPSLAPRASP